MGLGLNGRFAQLSEVPTKAYRGDLGMGCQEAIKIASAVAKSPSLRGETDTGHQHHIRHHKWAVGTRNPTFVTCFRRLTIPQLEMHGDGVFSGKG